MEKLPFFIHGMSITDQAEASNVGAEHRLRFRDWMCEFPFVLVGLFAVPE